jgi:tetratricopeptide (TPR) repeat protein
MKTIAAMLFLGLAFGNLLGQSTANNEPRPIIDGTGTYGKAIVSKLSTDLDGKLKNNVHPFVVGYCGWRVRVITSYPLTKLDGMQMGLCKTILDFFDPQLTPTLTAIENNAQSMTNMYNVSQAESKTIQDFVVKKYGLYYMAIDNPSTKPDAVAKWKYGVGSDLGELAAHLTIWWRIWSNPKYETAVAALLAGLDDDIKSAPKGVDPAFLTNLKKLQALGTKTTFLPAERRQVNELLTQTLLSSVGLTNIANANPPIPNGNAASILPPVPTGKTAAEYFETGKAFAEKGDHTAALIEFDQAAKLDPTNAAIFFRRALSLEKLGSSDDALRDYNAVILMRFSLREAYFNRGTLFLNKKDFKAAIADFNASLALDPKFQIAIYNRGLAYYNTNNLYAALTDFTNLLKLQPQHVNALIMRSYIYCAQGLGMSAFKDQELATQLGGKFERGCK